MNILKLTTNSIKDWQDKHAKIADYKATQRGVHSIVAHNVSHFSKSVGEGGNPGTLTEGRTPDHRLLSSNTVNWD